MKPSTRPAFQRSALDLLVKLPLLACALVVPAALTGCGMGTASQTSTTAFSLNGRVHGGQQAVANALVQLWAAGTSATATTPAVAPKLLVANGQYFLGGTAGCTPSTTQTCYNGVYTDQNGGFTFTGDYTCPSASAQVYVTVKGGNPGLSPTTNNAALLMMDPLGSCGNLTPSTSIYIDEITTAATAWALSQFTDLNGNIAASPHQRHRPGQRLPRPPPARRPQHRRRPHPRRQPHRGARQALRPRQRPRQLRQLRRHQRLPAPLPRRHTGRRRCPPPTPSPPPSTSSATRASTSPTSSTPPLPSRPIPTPCKAHPTTGP